MSKSHGADNLKEKWETIKEKGSEFAHNVKEKSTEVAHNLETNPNTKDFWKYVTENKKEAILGALMVLGLIFSFYWLGSFVVGLAVGLYAPWGIKGLWYRAQEFLKAEGKFPAFIICVGFILILFHVFSFVVGAVVGLLVKSIMINEFSSEQTPKKSSKK